MKQFLHGSAPFLKRISILPFFLLFVFQAIATQVKFSVDMTYQINDGSFHISTDHVYLRGEFNAWDLSNPMVSEGNGVYSTTINLNANTWYEFKFFTDAGGFSNLGFEHTVGAGRENRILRINTEAAFDIGKVFFNNANLEFRKSGQYYEIYSAVADTQYVGGYAKFLDDNATRIVNVLETSMPGKVKIWIFPDRKSFMISFGNPTGPDWVGGSAFGHSDLIILSPRIYSNGNIDVTLVGHEFAHAVVDCKKNSYVHAWLNEGAACYYGGEPSAIGLRVDGQIRDLINNKYHGVKPDLSSIESYSFADNDGYPLSVSIADFIINTFGSSKFAQFIVNTDYSVLGFASKAEFQAAWHKFIDDVYLPPAVFYQLKVDMSYYISKGWFNPQSDKVYIGGPFTSWFPYLMNNEGNGFYSYTLPCLQNKPYEYKFKINTAGAANGGWEDLAGTNRMLHTSASDGTIAMVAFNNENPTLSVLCPNAGELLLAGDSTVISWKYTSIPEIKIEYSADNKASWSTISNSVPAKNMRMNWKVPDVSSNNMFIRITDIANSTTYDENDQPFLIVKANPVEGPYPADENTMLLMHFENNLHNSSAYSGDGNLLGTGSVFADSSPLDAGHSFQLDGNDCITIPYSSSLNLTGDWTLEAWVKFTSFSSDHMYLFYKPGDTDPYQSNYSLEVNPWWGNVFYGFYFAAFNNRIGIISASPSLNKWYHVAFIRDTKQSLLSLLIHDQGHNLVASNEYRYTDPGTFLNTKNLQIGTGITGCIDEVRISNVIRSFITTGIDETADSKEISVYPNPGSGSINVNPPAGVTAGKIRILDMSGRTVGTYMLTGANIQNIDVSQFNRGIYLVQLLSNETTWSKKIILK